MWKTINEIKQALPKPSVKLGAMANGVDRMQAMEALANSEGWKMLIRGLEQTQETCINKLIASLDSVATFDYVKGLIAEIKTARSLMETIDSRKNIGVAMESLTAAFKKEASV